MKKEEKPAKEEKRLLKEAMVSFWLYFKRDWLRLDQGYALAFLAIFFMSFYQMLIYDSSTFYFSYETIKLCTLLSLSLSLLAHVMANQHQDKREALSSKDQLRKLKDYSQY